MKKLILKRDVRGLGKIGDTVSAKDGYARNFLIPQGLALEHSSSNIKILEEEKKREKKEVEKEKKKAEELKEKISKVSCTIPVKVGEEGKLFGSVTLVDIASALVQEGIEIDKRKIELDEPIKVLGVYTVPVRLHPEVSANIKVWVVKE